MTPRNSIFEYRRQASGMSVCCLWAHARWLRNRDGPNSARDQSRTAEAYQSRRGPGRKTKTGKPAAGGAAIKTRSIKQMIKKDAAGG